MTVPDFSRFPDPSPAADTSSTRPPHRIVLRTWCDTDLEPVGRDEPNPEVNYRTRILFFCASSTCWLRSLWKNLSH